MSGIARIGWKYRFSIFAVLFISCGFILLFYAVLRMLGIRQINSLVIVTPLAVLFLGMAMKATRYFIRVAGTGKDEEMWPALTLAEKPWQRKALFWMLTPLLIPVFMYLYLLPVSFLMWLLSLLFETQMEQHKEIVDRIISIMCLGLAFITTTGLWRQYKKEIIKS